MNKTALGAVVLASVLTSANASKAKVFGELGAIGNVGIGEGNTVYMPGVGKGKARHAGLKAKLGVEFGTRSGDFGVGITGGFSPYGNPSNSVTRHSGSEYYRSPYADLSELYYKNWKGYSGFVVGRYDASKFLVTSDWFGGYNQGLVFTFNTRSAGVWGTWINDWMNTGYNSNADLLSESGRHGLDLSSFSQFRSTRTRPGIGSDIFAGGLDMAFGDAVGISAHGAYWMAVSGNPLAQAGVRAIIRLGSRDFASTTTIRALWQNSIRVDNDSGIMLWGDQEFMVKSTFKFGGGYVNVGKKSVYSLTDRTRFYGQLLTPGTISKVNVNRMYFGAQEVAHYAFLGVKISRKLDLDVLYAGGGYNELSAILNWEVMRKRDTIWSVGGGFVTDKVSSPKQNGVVFTKLSF